MEKEWWEPIIAEIKADTHDDLIRYAIMIGDGPVVFGEGFLEVEAWLDADTGGSPGEFARDCAKVGLTPRAVPYDSTEMIVMEDGPFGKRYLAKREA